MIPVRLLVIGPLSVIEIRLLPHIDVIALSSRVILVCLRVNTDSCIQLIVYVVGLPRNRIGQYFICFLNLLEVNLSLLLLFVRLLKLKVRMVLLGHLVIGQLDLLLIRVACDLQNLVKSLLFFPHVENEALEGPTLG